jgi:hypothetical protein
MQRAGAALDANEEQVFVRELLRKMSPSGQGLARVDSATLTPGEQQYCLAMAQRGRRGGGERARHGVFIRP